jgi:hypothetical protein
MFLQDIIHYLLLSACPPPHPFTYLQSFIDIHTFYQPSLPLLPFLPLLPLLPLSPLSPLSATFSYLPVTAMIYVVLHTQQRI